MTEAGSEFPTSHKLELVRDDCPRSTKARVLCYCPKLDPVVILFYVALIDRGYSVVLIIVGITDSPNTTT